MLDSELVAKAARRLKDPIQRTEAADRVVFARMVANSQRLEGIDTSVDEVLEAADAYARENPEEIGGFGI